MTASLDGRVALVTGASRGIGAAVAEALAARGAEVVLVARPSPDLEATARTLVERGARAAALGADLLDPEAILALPDRAAAALGEVEILVNNAGLADSAPLHRSSDELWDRTMALNLRAPFLLTRVFGRRMAARGRGRIVDIASTAGRKGYPYTAAYTASKHALMGATRAQAKEFAGRGVTVNAVCPGFVDTPMTAATLDNIVARTGLSRDEAVRALCADSPLGRLVRPDEVADAVLAFVLQEGDAVTAQALGVDGGAVEG